MNFKFLLAVFVVAVALMPTAHSNRGNAWLSTAFHGYSTIPLFHYSAIPRLSPVPEPQTDSCGNNVKIHGSRLEGVGKAYPEVTGFYKKQPGMVNGRAWYQSSNGYAIYLAGNGNWHINSKKKIGTLDSDIWKSGQAKCPHDDNNNWKYWNKNGPGQDQVMEDPTLRVDSVQHALIVSGGSGIYTGFLVEAFVPSTGQHCQLPSIPANPNRQFGPRYGHSMEGNKICSGGPDHGRANCISLTDGTWNLANVLRENRMFHSSWVSPSGRRLLGSFFSWDTTEKLREDGSGTSDNGFSLRYNSFQACPINLGNTVILTGGATYYDYKPTPRVVEYNEEGYLRDLPQLQVQRRDHGCGYYVNQDGIKTFLVAGGNGAIDQTLSSTELLLDQPGSAWVLTGELPSPRTALRGAKLGNKILMTGGVDDDSTSDEILEFDPHGRRGGTWRLVDKMLQPRSAHAVSVIPFEEFEGLCV